MDDVQVKIQLMIEVVGKQMEKLNKTVQKSTGSLLKYFNSQKRVITASLALMFASQRLNFFFSSMLHPALQLAGVFDLLNATLGIVFLPIALSILDALLPIMLFFINLPEPVQKTIGGFVALGAIITGLIAFLAPLFLALAQFVGVPAIIGAIGTAFAALATILLPVALIVGALIALWMTNLGGFRDFVKSTLGIIGDQFKSTFIWIKDTVLGIWKLFTDLFKGDWDAVNKDIGDIFINTIKFIIASAMRLGDLFYNVFVFLVNALSDLLIKVLGGYILYNIHKIFEGLSMIPGPIGEIAGKVAGAINTARDWVQNNPIKLSYVTAEQSQARINQINSGIDYGMQMLSNPTSMNVNVTVKADQNMNVRSGIPMSNP